VTIVGYDAAGFIIRNSWSSGWGKEGFAVATDAYVAKAFTEAYGVIA
jgi:aminopeptidase C